MTNSNNNEDDDRPLNTEGEPLFETPQQVRSGRINVVLVGIGFLFLFSGFNTTSNYLTSALDKNTALISLSILYATFALSNFVSPIVVKVAGPRLSMFFASCLYILFILSAIRIYEAVYYVASALCGFGAAVLWTAQGAFLTSCSTPTTMSFHSGLFFAIFQVNSLIGPIAAFVLVKKDFGFAFIFFTFFIIASAGTVILLFLRPVQTTAGEVKSAHTASKLLSLIKDTALLFADLRIWCLLFLVFYAGASAAFFSGVYPSLMSKLTVAIALICFGAGEVIGSLSAGHFAGIIGRRFIFLASFIFQASALVVVYFLVEGNFSKIMVHDIQIMFCLGNLLFGLGDACLQTMVYSILGNMFSDRSAQAFAWYKLLQSLGYTASFLISIPLVHNVVAIVCYFLGVLCVFGFIGVVFLDMFLYKINFVDEK